MLTALVGPSRLRMYVDTVPTVSYAVFWPATIHFWTTLS